MKPACKDCGSTTRNLSRPGPRCATCKRERRNALREASWARGIKERYGLTAEQYWALYEAQGRTCYICRRANGKAKRLAVDHDHSSGFVRGLLCGPCNNILAHLRDDADAAYRVGDYLVNPPAFSVVGKVKPSGSE